MQSRKIKITKVLTYNPKMKTMFSHVCFLTDASELVPE